MLRCNSGMAGGTLPQHAGPGEAVFSNNSFAGMGDLGSKVLKPAPSGTIWTAGTSVKVSWGIRYNVRLGSDYVAMHKICFFLLATNERLLTRGMLAAR